MGHGKILFCGRGVDFFLPEEVPILKKHISYDIFSAQ